MITRVLTVSLLLVALLIAACGGSKVPDVTGRSFAEAEATLQDAGLTVSVEGSHEGTVASQVPGPGEPIPDSKVVTLVLERGGGGATAAVPNVMNMTVAEGRAALESAGFVLGEVTRKVVDKPAGVIVDQSPLPDNTLPTGQPVTVVAADEQLVLVPALKGKSEADAKAALVGLLEVGTVEKMCLRNTDPANAVYESNPKEGDSTVRTNKILLRIKDDCAEVPTLKKLDAVTAIRRIQARQLVGRLAGTQFDASTALNEKVARSAPDEGILVPKGSTVDLTLFTTQRGVPIDSIRLRVLQEVGRAVRGGVVAPTPNH